MTAPAGVRAERAGDLLVIELRREIEPGRLRWVAFAALIAAACFSLRINSPLVLATPPLLLLAGFALVGRFAIAEVVRFDGEYLVHVLGWRSRVVETAELSWIRDDPRGWVAVIDARGEEALRLARWQNARALTRRWIAATLREHHRLASAPVWAGELVPRGDDSYTAA